MAAPPPPAGTEGVPRLLRGLDTHKDQTYFLASVLPAALRRVLFPVGHLPVRVEVVMACCETSWLVWFWKMRLTLPVCCSMGARCPVGHLPVSKC